MFVYDSVDNLCLSPPFPASNRSGLGGDHLVIIRDFLRPADSQASGHFEASQILRETVVFVCG